MKARKAYRLDRKKACFLNKAQSMSDRCPCQSNQKCPPDSLTLVTQYVSRYPGPFDLSLNWTGQHVRDRRSELYSFLKTSFSRKEGTFVVSRCDKRQVTYISRNTSQNVETERDGRKGGITEALGETN